MSSRSPSTDGSGGERRLLSAAELHGAEPPPADACLEGPELQKAYWQARGLARERERREAYWAASNQAVADAYAELEERTAELKAAREELVAMNRGLEALVRAQVAQIIERAAEVEGLNAQLTLQVRERSRELLAALHRMTTPVGPLAEGAQIGGRIRVIRQLGRGGMGDVYLAEDLVMKRTLAVKLMRPSFSGTPTHLHRFIVEAAAAAAVPHPAIVRTFHIDVTDDGRLYQLMEFVDGPTLAEARARTSLPVPACVRIGAVVAGALAAAHARGVVHRDVKPSNLILCREATGVRVLDFGLSKVRGGEWEATDNPTGATEILGTPAYMSPEQIASPASVGPPSDVYSLGVVLYELASGRQPFRNAAVQLVLAAHMHDAPPPLADAPAGLAEVVFDCLAKDPARRPTAAELAERLDRLAVALDAPAAERLLELVPGIQVGGDDATHDDRRGRSARGDV